MIRSTIILLSFCLVPASLQAEHLLWYQQAAANWNEALPIGNGRMGAMVFGNPDNERIQLNEDSMWAGERKDVKLSIGTPADLAEMRKLIDENKLAEADREIVKRFSRGGVRRSHQTLGDLHIDWKNTGKPVTGYRRQLDLKTGIATTTWKRGDTTFTQEVFCSNPDEALFIKLTANGPETLHFDIRLDRPLDQGTTTHQVKATTHGKVKSLTMTGQVTQVKAKLQTKPFKGMKGCHFAANLDAITPAGTIKLANQQLQVSGAQTVYLKLTAGTNFGGKKINITPNKPDSATLPEKFSTLRTRHTNDHAALYNRCHLDLPSSP
jgi:alpha-L-fucosidase 2